MFRRSGWTRAKSRAPITSDEVAVRLASTGDLEGLLALFDARVGWLAARGLEGQWGRRPFSQIDWFVDELAARVVAGDTWIAEDHAGLAGTVSLGVAPAYAPLRTGPEVYVHGLVTRLDPPASGVGRRLLRHAEHTARQLHVEKVRLDCWSGGSGALVSYYRSAGYEPVAEVEVDGWRGTVMSKPVAA